MKRSREQVRTLPDAGNARTRPFPPARARVRIAAPVPTASVVPTAEPRALGKKSNEASWRRKDLSHETKKSVVPPRPPPPVQPFSDETKEAANGEPASLPSPVDGQTEPEAKRRIKEVLEKGKKEEWRKVAEGILAGGPVRVGKGTSKRSFAVVCSSNINRSIMAQKLLEKNDMRAKSYGTGR